jgi:hypothetical protein
MSLCDYLALRLSFVRSQTNPVAGLRGTSDSGISRMSYFLDNRFIYGGDVISVTRRRALLSQEDLW